MRISESQIARGMLNEITRNRSEVHKYGNELSTGYKVTTPGDSKFSGTIAQYRDLLERIEGHTTRIKSLEGTLSFQDEIVSQANDAVLRALEIATQGANETNGVENRAQLAVEIFELRDLVVQLANSRYQGRYIYSGAADDVPPYSLDEDGYTEPAEAPANEMYVFVDNVAASFIKSIKVTDDMSISVNTPGNEVFGRAILALESLGRALSNYDTTVDNGASTGAGTTFDTFQDQTAAITAALDLLKTAREEDIMPERVNLGGRMKRLEAAESVLSLSSFSAHQVLNQLQNADFVESASNLSQAQTALEASLAVSSRILQQSILDYL